MVPNGKQHDHGYGTAFLGGNDTIPIGRLHLRGIRYALLYTTPLHRTTIGNVTYRASDE